MQTRTSTAPSADAAWETRRVTAGGREHAVLVLPASGGYLCLPKRPGLAVRPGDEPRFGLTLVLRRAPTPAEPSLWPLIDHALVNFVVTAAVPAAVLDALSHDLGTPCEPLFARSATFALSGGGAPLAQADGAGAGAEVALSAMLERDQALAALTAFQGGPSALVVAGSLAYRVAPRPLSVHLTGRWSDVYDALRRRSDATGALPRAVLDDELRTLIASGVVSSNGLVAAGVSTDPAVVDVLRRAAGFFLVQRAPEVYGLRDRGPGLMPLDVEETVQGAAEASVRIAAPLAGVLHPAVDGWPADRLVSIVAPDADTSPGLRAVPPLVRSAPASRALPAAARLSLVDRGTHLESLQLALSPQRAPSAGAAALIRGDAARPIRFDPDVVLHEADDVVIVPEPDFVEPDYESLPVVEDPAADVFRDAAVTDLSWYAPGFSLALPSPDQDPATSPFRFSLAAKGVTTGPGLTTGLEGQITLTVDQVAPAGVDPGGAAASIRAGTAGCVPIANPSVTLEVPFRDSGSPDTRVQTFVAAVEQTAQGLTAHVDLLDDWVRLAYGALSYPGFQAVPARLRIAYAFRAYVPLGPLRLDYAFGGKIAETAIGDPVLTETPVNTLVGDPLRPEELIASDAVTVADPVFAPAELTLRMGPSAVQLEREAGPLPRALPGRVVPAVATRSLPVSVAPAAARQQLAVARPPLRLPPGRFQPPRYIARTIVREHVVDVLLPCSTYGGLYLQRTATGDEPIGCRDVLRLGETDYRQYEEIEALATSELRVFRSLQQPGRFLVVPAAYRITRYGPSEPPDRAYRPVLLLYGIVDPPAPDRYFLSATLQPDIAPSTLRDLRAALAPYTPHGHDPALDLPTDPGVQATAAYSWALPSGIDQPVVHQVWDTFQVTVSTGLVNALALTTLIERAGLEGAVDFTLASGVRLTSRLVLDTQVAGPWEAGPLAVTAAGDQATVVNRCEQPVQLHELVVGSGARAGERIPAEAALAAGATTTVSVGAGAQDLYAGYTRVPAALTLKELNVFVEDVRANVLFVNLVAFANHGLAALEIHARLHGTDHDYAMTLADGQTGTVDMTLPLTTYLDDQLLEFQVTKHLTGGDIVPMPWRSWDLKGQGAVVSITPDMV